MDYDVEHLGLASRETESLKDWYVRVLGGEVVFATEQSPRAFLIRLGGGFIVEIYPAESALSETANNRLAGWRHLALRVESIEEARDELAERGVVFTEVIKPAGGAGRVLFFQDPDKNLLHLVERPKTFLPLA